MKKPTKLINPKILQLVAIIVIIELVLSITGTVITFPTAQHRAIGREMSSLQPFDGQPTTTDRTNRFTKLHDTPEGQYIEKAGIITGVTQMIVSFAMIAVLYTQIRKRRLSGDPVSSTAISYTFVTLLMTPLGTLINNSYIGDNSWQFLPFASSLVAGTLITFVIAYVIASILHSRYNRKHSFEVV